MCGPVSKNGLTNIRLQFAALQELPRAPSSTRPASSPIVCPYKGMSPFKLAKFNAHAIQKFSQLNRFFVVHPRRRELKVELNYRRSLLAR